MKDRVLTKNHVHQFAAFLCREEKSAATQEKYLRDIYRFAEFAADKAITKEVTTAWKKRLLEQGYAVRSVNSMLASLNSFLDFWGWNECKVKNLRLQRPVYCAEDKELTKNEYLRLLAAAEQNEQLRLVMQTICATGIRVSELRYFTVEAMRCGEITVYCKNKTRTILVPSRLKKMLMDYAYRNHIYGGAIFLSRCGKPMDRSCIWRQMKQLCRKARVKESKVFPHNLRRLFARTFHGAEKDIVKLADVLGHSSINTTRIYVMTPGKEHRRRIERLGLLIQA